MRYGLLRALALTASALYASSALAFFDVQVLAGKRWYELTGDYDKNVASQEIEIAAHIDPIPLVPVAFGVSAAMGDLEKGDLGDEVNEAKVFEAGLDIMAWLPMIPVITPYARLKYPVMGTMAIESKYDADRDGDDEKVAIVHKLSGPQLGIGAKWSPLPVLKLLVEVQRGMQKVELDSYKVDGAKDDSAGSLSGDAGSNAFLLGVEIGL